jgi:hypothetical protein
MLRFLKSLGLLAAAVVDELGFVSYMLDFYPFFDGSAGQLILFEEPHQLFEGFLVDFDFHNLCHLLYDSRMLRVRFVEHHEFGVLLRIGGNSYDFPKRLGWKISRRITFYSDLLHFPKSLS